MIGQLLVERYLILEQLGTGGFSETYLARDKYRPQYPLCVVKWLKLPAESSLSPATAQRLFAMEARLLEHFGQQHGQIPTLLAYCPEPDQTYLVLDYIEGDPLDTWLVQGKRLASSGAIALLLDVLPILAHLHAQHVVHHDLKPSNLIHRHADRQVVLIDFGAAQMLSPQSLDAEAGVGDWAESALATTAIAPAHAIGTPGYMPPEQSQGLVQCSSDLYALGMVVIHLLTGIDPQQLTLDPIAGEMEWHHHLTAAIAPELMAILDRMVRMQARDRYTNAQAVLTDLEHLSAAAPRATQRAKPHWFVTPRRPGRAWLQAAAAVVVVAGGAGGLYAQSHGGQLDFLSRGSQPETAQANLVKLHDLAITSPVNRMMIAPNNQVLVTANTDRVLQLWSLPTGTRLQSLVGTTGTVTALDISQDSRWLLSSSDDNRLRLWNMAEGKLVRTLQQTAVTAVAMSPDAQTLVSGGRDGMLYLWDAATGKLRKTLSVSKSAVTAVVYGLNPHQVITATDDHQIQVWNLQTGERDRVFTGHADAIVGLQVMDAETLVSYGKDRTLRWNLKSEELDQVFSRDSATTGSVTASASQQDMIMVDQKGMVRVWNYKVKSPRSRELGKLSQDLTVALSPNHRYMACWKPDHPLRLWQINASEKFIQSAN
jgi:serine/threonine protein kinase